MKDWLYQVRFRVSEELSEDLRSKNKLNISKQIQKMLSNSKVVVSGWHHNHLVGFGRATTDDIFRAVLWDIVVDKKYEHHGIGRKIISSIKL